MQLKRNKKFIEELKSFIQSENKKELIQILQKYHVADVAEILQELTFEEMLFVLKILDNQQYSNVLLELEENTRNQVLQNLSSRDIAQKIDSLPTDDAVDLIEELSKEAKNKVISRIENTAHTKNIVDLLRYDKDSAGGLMQKEYLSVREKWTNLHCIKQLRDQAKYIKKIHTIYVIDNSGILKGRLSSKILLTTATKTLVKDVYNDKIISANVNDPKEKVAALMQKYDLFVIPVVDEMNALVGQITVDDVIDIIKEEAEKDYQMAAGISEDVEANDSIWALTKARLPWLTLGLLGGLVAAFIMGGFEKALEAYKILFLFTPLIAAMAGNVGVQSSAIIVQAIANNNLKGSIFKRLLKEMGLGLINGFALAFLIGFYGYFLHFEPKIIFAIALSLLIVVVMAAFIGTFIPIILHTKGIDPAIATGPFITTSNDIFGIFIYFFISKIILGF